jgi:hypothetical protein
MKWVAVLFGKDTVVVMGGGLKGGKLTGPGHTLYFVNTSVAKATVPNVNVLRGR